MLLSAPPPRAFLNSGTSRDYRMAFGFSVLARFVPVGQQSVRKRSAQERELKILTEAYNSINVTPNENTSKFPNSAGRHLCYLNRIYSKFGHFQFAPPYHKTAPIQGEKTAGSATSETHLYGCKWIHRQYSEGTVFSELDDLKTMSSLVGRLTDILSAVLWI